MKKIKKLKKKYKNVYIIEVIDRLVEEKNEDIVVSLTREVGISYNTDEYYQLRKRIAKEVATISIIYMVLIMMIVGLVSFLSFSLFYTLYNLVTILIAFGGVIVFIYFRTIQVRMGKHDIMIDPLEYLNNFNNVYPKLLIGMMVVLPIFAMFDWWGIMSFVVFLVLILLTRSKLIYNRIIKNTEVGKKLNYESSNYWYYLILIYYVLLIITWGFIY